MLRKMLEIFIKFFSICVNKCSLLLTPENKPSSFINQCWLVNIEDIFKLPHNLYDWLIA
jgi:hypothetical protein